MRKARKLALGLPLFSGDVINGVSLSTSGGTAGSIIFSVLSVSACKKYVKFGVVFLSIKLNTCSQYVLNPNIESPTMHEILLFRVMLCAIVLFFGATYDITLFINTNET